MYNTLLNRVSFACIGIARCGMSDNETTLHSNNNL